MRSLRRRGAVAMPGGDLMISICLDGYVVGDPRVTTFRNGSPRTDVILEATPEGSAPLRFELRVGGTLGERAATLTADDWVFVAGKMATVGAAYPTVVVFVNAFELIRSADEPVQENELEKVK
jgi:hypothetical protein